MPVIIDLDVNYESSLLTFPNRGRLPEYSEIRQAFLCGDLWTIGRWIPTFIAGKYPGIQLISGYLPADQRETYVCLCGGQQQLEAYAREFRNADRGCVGVTGIPGPIGCTRDYRSMEPAPMRPTQREYELQQRKKRYPPIQKRPNNNRNLHGR